MAGPIWLPLVAIVTLGAALLPAATIHREAVVVDLHVDTVLDLAAGRRTLDGRVGGGHVDLPRLREGGVDVQVFAAFVHPREAARGRRRARLLTDAFRRAAGAYPDRITHVRTAAEMDAAVKAGRVAAVLSIENGGDAVEGDPAHLEGLYREGVRMLGLTWNQANAFGDGALQTHHGGLTDLGRRALARMQALGMVVDVSHLSAEAFWDALAATKGPLIASHSNADAIHPHVRNLTDAQLRALAARGSAVGVNFYPPFLGAATLERVVAHIDHMVRVMGIDHVALGSDFDGITQAPRGLEDVSRLPNLTRALLARGYTRAEIEKILGTNALRVFRRVWKP